MSNVLAKTFIVVLVGFLSFVLGVVVCLVYGWFTGEPYGFRDAVFIGIGALVAGSFYWDQIPPFYDQEE